MKKWLMLIVLMIPLVSAAENYNNYSSLDVNVRIENEIENKNDGTVKSLTTELDFFPREFEYQIVSNEFTTSPDAVIEEGEAIKFIWNEKAGSYSYTVNSNVNRKSDFVEITRKIGFPAIVNNDYTKASEFIDLNDEIQDMAEEIVQGEDDMYAVIFKLANWTEANVKYDMNTLTSSSVQKSSWVLENKEGVCDELTGLFISFCRSLGIPARFVSGIAYTNILDDFGAHGWAEVYIDGKWIPVDVTYGQYGWVDPSHIKFKDSVDSGEDSASFEWSGSAEFDIKELEVEANIVSAKGSGKKYVDLSIESLIDNTGPGSYVPIQIDVKNSNNFYVPAKLTLTKAPEVVGKNVKNILLKPNEERSIFWIVKTPENTEDNFIYSTIIGVETMYGGSAENKFNYRIGNEIISKEKAEEMIKMLGGDEKDTLNAHLDCSMDKEIYYENEQGVLTCESSGVDSVCFNEDCKKEGFVWNLDMKEYNTQRYVVTAKKDGKSKYEYFDLQIIKEPSLIVDVEPKRFNFNENIDLNLVLESNQELKDVIVKIDDYGELKIDNLNGKKELSLQASGKQFRNGEINLEISYKDLLGKAYSTNQAISVNVEEIPLHYKLILFLENLFS